MLEQYVCHPIGIPPERFNELDIEFSFAFQPIVSAKTREVVSFEALVRGPRGEPSKEVLDHVDERKVFEFDLACHTKAIKLANSLKLKKSLHLNLFPHALYQTGMNIRATMYASISNHIPIDQIIYELTESEKITDNKQLIELVRMYQEFGFSTAIDDFGSGYSGLSLLVEYQPNYIKIDQRLIANVDTDPVRQIVVQGICSICKKLNIEVMAEGVEKPEEYEWLRRAGLDLFQGYYFAYPAFEALPDVDMALFKI